jgi:O-antigen/teichoic acid export membrane protein
MERQPGFYDFKCIRFAGNSSGLENGLAYAAIYTLAQNVASLIQAPQRGIISSSVGALSRAWKDKDMEKINRHLSSFFY